VLLTNEYPYARGDASFLVNEIDALAARFDDVVVFNYPSPGSTTTTDLPPGVRFGGTLKGPPRWRPLFALLRPDVMLRTLRTLELERRAGRLKGRLKAEGIAALAGVKRSRDASLRHALGEPGWRVTVYAFWAAGAGIAVPYIGRVRGRVALRLHGYDLYDERAGRLPLRASLFRRADVVLPISHHGYDYLRSRFPSELAADKLVLSRLGTADHGIARRTEEGPVTLLSCSSVSEVKRVELVHRAAVALSRRRPVRWVHLGGGPQLDALREAVDTTPAPGLSVELRGQATHQEVLHVLGTEPIDVFVNASSSEGVPVSIMEALSFDVPVVATDAGGSGELVGEEMKTGRLVPVDSDAETIASAVQDVLEHREDLTPRLVWALHCDARTNAARLVDLLLPPTEESHV